MKVLFRHARNKEVQNFYQISSPGGWSSVVEDIMDLVDLDKPRVGIIARNRQIILSAGQPMEHCVEVAFIYNARQGRGGWVEVDEDWNGLAPCLSEGFPRCYSPLK